MKHLNPNLDPIFATIDVFNFYQTIVHWSFHAIFSLNCFFVGHFYFLVLKNGMNK